MLFDRFLLEASVIRIEPPLPTSDIWKGCDKETLLRLCGFFTPLPRELLGQDWMRDDEKLAWPRDERFVLIAFNRVIAPVQAAPTIQGFGYTPVSTVRPLLAFAAYMQGRVFRPNEPRVALAHGLAHSDQYFPELGLPKPVLLGADPCQQAGRYLFTVEPSHHVFEANDTFFLAQCIRS